jgi:hypothetical protein
MLARRQRDATDRTFIAIQSPCSPGRYRERIDLAPLKDEIGAVNPLILLQTVGQIP